MKIGVLGATGPAGRGLAARLASVGFDVLVGSRDASRATEVVGELKERWGGRLESLSAGSNEDAVRFGDVVVLAVPWQATIETAASHSAELVGKVVISMANALEKVGGEFRAVIPPFGSIAAGVQLAAPGAKVAIAFQHIPAVAFGSLDSPVLGDVIVCACDLETADLVTGLVESIPDLRSRQAGSLANALGVEAFAAALLSVNLRHGGRSSLRLVGLND